jgi:hypothetical protein
MLQYAAHKPYSYANTFSSRSMLCLVLREEFADAATKDVVHDHARNGASNPAAVALSARLRPIMIDATANVPDVPIV